MSLIGKVRETQPYDYWTIASTELFQVVETLLLETGTIWSEFY